MTVLTSNLTHRPCHDKPMEKQNGVLKDEQQHEFSNVVVISDVFGGHSLEDIIMTESLELLCSLMCFHIPFRSRHQNKVCCNTSQGYHCYGWIEDVDGKD